MGGMEINSVPGMVAGTDLGAVIFFSVKGILFPQRCGNGISLAGNTIFR
jgi:hypothetical protein